MQICSAARRTVGADRWRYQRGKALVTAAQQITDEDVQEVSATGGNNASGTSPIVPCVDLEELAGNWLSRPRHLSGLTPAQMIARIEVLRGNVIAAAVFGLAPALDNRGTTETRVALAILRAITGRFGKGAT